MNIKIFNNDLPEDIDLSNEKVVALDNEALGLVLGRDPLTLVQKILFDKVKPRKLRCSKFEKFLINVKCSIYNALC